ncbi:hypothetical protein ACOMHN_017028 [Nucella lapillus]
MKFSASLATNTSSHD